MLLFKYVFGGFGYYVVVFDVEDGGVGDGLWLYVVMDEGC